MEKEIKSVKNPLTIIAIFASLAEVASTGVLPFLDSSLQNTFVWFVMGFPVLLVSLFFFTLFRKHHVLYAPSDFKSDESFTGLAINIRSQSASEISDKNKIEIEEIQDSHEVVALQVNTNNQQPLLNNPKIEYFLAEELAIKKLNEQYGDRISSNQSFEIEKNKYSIDALINTSLELAFFEIKYFPRLKTTLSGIGKTYNYFLEISNRLKLKDNRLIMFHIIIVTSISDVEKSELQKRINDFLANKEIRLNISIMDFELLKNEFGFKNV